MYIEGFVVPVPAANKEAYRKFAADTWPLFKEFGALRLVEAWGDNVPEGKLTDFYRSVAAEPGEVPVFAWLVWPSRAVRDSAQERMRTDARMQPPTDAPFNMQRMIFGAFEVLVDEGEKV
ncbi:MAG TPA: DUF1428 domain-containing protein [Caulobacteraceae bacterium]